MSVHDKSATQNLDHLYDSARWHRLRKHHGDVNKFWLGELQSLCQHCHVTAKYDIETRGYRRDIGFDGWPLDPRHPCYLWENKNKPDPK